LRALNALFPTLPKCRNGGDVCRRDRERRAGRCFLHEDGEGAAAGGLGFEEANLVVAVDQTQTLGGEQTLCQREGLGGRYRDGPPAAGLAGRILCRGDKARWFLVGRAAAGAEQQRHA